MRISVACSMICSNLFDSFNFLFASCFVIFPLSSALIPPMCSNVASFSLSMLLTFYLHPAARTMKPFPRTEAKDCKGCHRVNESILKRVSRFLRRSLLRSLSSRSFGNALWKELKILLNFTLVQNAVVYDTL